MNDILRLDLAHRFLREGRYAASRRLVEPLTQRAPRTKEDLAAYRVRARADYGMGHAGAAEQAARAVLSRRPKEAGTMRLLVRALIQQGRHREAATWMSRLDELGTDTWNDDSGMPPAPVVRRPRRRAA